MNFKFARRIKASADPVDTITLDTQLMTRLLELSRESLQTDEQLHDVMTALIAQSKQAEVLSMKDYDAIVHVAGVLESEDQAGVEVDAEKWSGKVHEKWHAPEGFFSKSAESIAEGLLRSAHGDAAKAQSRLSFYRNRAGKNLSEEDHGKLQHAADLIHKHTESAHKE